MLHFQQTPYLPINKNLSFQIPSANYAFEIAALSLDTNLNQQRQLLPLCPLI